MFNTLFLVSGENLMGQSSIFTQVKRHATNFLKNVFLHIPTQFFFKLLPKLHSQGNKVVCVENLELYLLTHYHQRKTKLFHLSPLLLFIIFIEG